MMNRPDMASQMSGGAKADRLTGRDRAMQVANSNASFMRTASPSVKMKKGGAVKASRGDGCCTKGRTKGHMC